MTVIRLPKRHKWNLIAGARDVAQIMPDADVVHAHLYFWRCAPLWHG